MNKHTNLVTHNLKTRHLKISKIYIRTQNHYLSYSNVKFPAQPK